ELQFQACLNAFEKAFRDADPFHNRDERHTLLLLIHGDLAAATLSGPLTPPSLLRPMFALPYPTQRLRAGRRLDRIADVAKHYMVLNFTEFRHQLQAFRAELQLQAFLNAFEQALLHADTFYNRDERHTLLLLVNDELFPEALFQLLR